MLVLSRQVEESLVIVMPDGREVEFKILDVRGDKVRIGTTAPADVKVHRLEVLKTIRRDAPRVAPTRRAIQLAPRVVETGDEYGHAEAVAR